MKKLLIIVAAIPAASQAETFNKALHSSAAPTTSSPTLDLALNTDFALGRELPFAAGDEIVDEGEFGASLTYSRSVEGLGVLKVTPGATISPNLFDEDDTSSAIYAQIRLQTSNVLTSRESTAGEPLDAKLQDTLVPFVTYRYTGGYTEQFENRTFIDHLISAGLSYNNTRLGFCTSGYVRQQQDECSRVLSIAVTPAIDVVASENDARRRFTPKLKSEFAIPLVGGFRLLAEGSAEWRMFSALKAANGKDREDKRVSGYVGVEAEISPALKFAVGGRGTKNYSNDKESRFDRGYLVLSLAYKPRLF